MDMVILKAGQPLTGVITPPPDKSFTHRAIILASIANGTSIVRNPLDASDIDATIECMTSMGVDIKKDSDRNELLIEGVGLYGLKEPKNVLDVRNSGTLLAMLMGLVSPQEFTVGLTGDASIKRRQQKMIVNAINAMGGEIYAAENFRAPFRIIGSKLTGKTFLSKMSSAQLKSAIILAGLYADSQTIIFEKIKSRDYTENFLDMQGARVRSCIVEENYYLSGTNLKGWNEISILPSNNLLSFDVTVPGDFSSASFFICAALMVPGSCITLKSVSLNETRTGLLDVLNEMGAKIEISNERLISFERIADITVRYQPLNGVTVQGGLITRLIDEIPILACLMAMAKGVSSIKNAERVKQKESNRISNIVKNLNAMGVNAVEIDDGMIIHGLSEGASLQDARIDTEGDHRIAMAFSILALCGCEKTIIKNADCVNVSYPKFYDDLESLTND